MLDNHLYFLDPVNKINFKIYLKKSILDDPKGLFRDVSQIGTFGVGHYEAVVTNDTDIDFPRSMVRQPYNYHYQ